MSGNGGGVHQDQQKGFWRKEKGVKNKVLYCLFLLLFYFIGILCQRIFFFFFIYFKLKYIQKGLSTYMENGLEQKSKRMFLVFCCYFTHSKKKSNQWNEKSFGLINFKTLEEIFI